MRTHGSFGFVTNHFSFACVQCLVGHLFGDGSTDQLTTAVQQCIIVSIYGKSHETIDAAKCAVLQLCDDESNVIVLDTEQDKLSIAKLTASEVNIYLISEDYIRLLFSSTSL